MDHLNNLLVPLLVHMSYPVVVVLAFLFWRVGGFVDEKSMKFMTFTFLMNLIAMILIGTQAPDSWSNFASSIQTLLLAYACIITFRPKWQYRQVVPVMSALVIVFLALDLKCSASNLTAISDKLRAAVDSPLSLILLIRLANYYRTIDLQKGSSILCYGIWTYAVAQCFVLPMAFGDHEKAEISKLIGYALGFTGKAIMTFGLEQMYALAAYKAKLDSEKAIDLKSALEHLHHELGTPLAELAVILQGIVKWQGIDGKLREQAIRGANAFERIRAIVLGSIDLALTKHGQDLADHLFLDHPESRELIDNARREDEIVRINSLIDIARQSVKRAARSLNRWSIPEHESFVEDGIQITAQYAGLCCCKVNSPEIIQIFINLLHNAYDSFGTQKGTIRITTKNEQERVQGLIEGDTGSSSDVAGSKPMFREIVRITVSDDGEGIPDENLAKLYVDGFTTRSGPGRGHGLAIVKGLVEKNGGSVTHIQRRGTGNAIVGTDVVVVFPRAKCLTSRKLGS